MMPQRELVKLNQDFSDFRLTDGEIGIDVVDRTYGVLCDCGSKTFTEDTELSAIRCAKCNRLLAVRAVIGGSLH